MTKTLQFYDFPLPIYYSIFDTFTLIDLAAACGSYECFKYLSINNCKIDENISTYAISGGNFDIISLLHQQGISFENELENAIILNYNQLADWILANYSCEPVSLVTCIKNFNYEALIYFLRNGASVQDLNEKHESLLHYCAEYGLIDLAKYLIRKENVDKEAICEPLLETPLHWAIIGNQLHMVKYLIEEENVDIEKTNKQELTPFLYSCLLGFLDICKYLAERNCNINALDFQGRGAVYCAAEGGHVDLVRYLVKDLHIETKIDTNRDEDHNESYAPARMYLFKNVTNPIFIAIVKGHLNIVKCLIEECDFDKEAYDVEGLTPLHTACRENKLDIVKYLVEEAHSELETLNVNHMTPMQDAAIKNCIDIVKYLIEEVHVDPKPSLTYRFAAFYGCKDVMNYFKEKFPNDVHDEVQEEEEENAPNNEEGDTPNNEEEGDDDDGEHVEINISMEDFLKLVMQYSQQNNP